MELTPTQYDVVLTLMSGAMATLAGAAVYFVLARQVLAPAYRTAMAVAVVVVSIAAVHYLRVIGAWEAAWVFEDGRWVESGQPFPEGLRYIDWLVTVPLLLTQLVLVLRLPAVEARSLIRRLVLASIAMIALGYPGELTDDMTLKAVLGVAGVLPFAYILYLLWVELSRSLFRYSEEVGLTVANARLLLVGSWIVYPLAFFMPVVGIEGSSAEVLRQAGYSIADVVSKAGYGLLVYRIARLLTEEEALGISAKDVGAVDLSDAGRALGSEAIR